MTRLLSELLGTAEPVLRASVATLERASGHPSADIRLTAEVLRGSKLKLKQLGLNPHDTTGPELYAALENRLRQDDRKLVTALQTASQSDDLVAGVAHALRTVPIPRSCFALKASVARQLFKKLPPKKAMKQLGYRSLDSLLKHEPMAQLQAAAWLLESPAWRKNLLEAYERLQPADFETRDVTILNPVSARWQKLGAQLTAEHRQTVLGIREFGAIVLLPLPPAELPAATTVTLLLALQTMNELRASSTFLKLCQVRPDFGHVVRTVTQAEPVIEADLLHQPVHWQVLQRYYARFRQAFKADIFEPHIQPEDLSWHSIELVLRHLEPELDFWRGTQHLSLAHDRQAVSFNIIDVALGVCNRLPYRQRIVHYGQLSLWHELLLKYLKHDSVEQIILGQLQSELVAEPALL